MGDYLTEKERNAVTFMEAVTGKRFCHMGGVGSQDAIEALYDALAVIAGLEPQIAALIEAGDRLNELAGHQDDCQIVTHGVWSDPIPCTCGYTEAVKAWKEVRGE